MIRKARRFASLWARFQSPITCDPRAAGVGIEGRARELNAACKVDTTGKSGGVAIPWVVIAGTAPDAREERAFTTTANLSGGVAQRPVLGRLFGPGMFDALGVRPDSVPSGMPQWPLITAGVTPTQKAEGSAADAAVAATFSVESLKPKRLTGKYEYTWEQSAQVADLEQALRRDLGDAVKSKMSDLLFNGNEATNPQEPNGFLEKLTRAERSDGGSDFRKLRRRGGGGC